MKLKFTTAGVINALGVVTILYLAVVLVGTVRRNYELDKQIAAASDTNSLLALQHNELAQRLVYYRTESFQERQARAKLGLQLPGESVLILPVRPTPAATPAPASPPPRGNLQQWLDFLAGRER